MACGLLVTVGLMGAAAFASGDEFGRKEAQRLTNLVRQDCGSCHGLTLKGGLGKPLTSEALRQWDREQVAAIILNGVPGTPMPPWRSLLSENEARWIADRLKRGELDQCGFFR
ncbi:MAG: cytochrome c [Xanthobacteraceae bacterium]